MEFVQLTSSQYQRFVRQADRVFLPQLPEYGAVRTRLGMAVDYVGVVSHADVQTPARRGQTPRARPDAAILAAGLVVLQPWKKIYRRALLSYGPTLDWSDSAMVDCFFAGLRAHLRRDRRILAVRFNPLLPRVFYHDIEIVAGNPTAARAERQLRALGARRIEKEFYQQSDVQIRYIYTKDISGMSFEEATATLAKGLRRRFHNEGRYGVEVRFLGPDDFAVFDTLHDATVERTSMASLSSASQEFYRALMRELGPERALLAVAYFSPTRYLQQIAAEREQAKARLEVLSQRRRTKACERETAELTERLEALNWREENAREALSTYGDEIPFNAALGFHSGNELLLLLGGMDKRFSAYARDYPVERALFKWACDHGVSIYNTFGISGIFDETAPDATVLTFKRWLNGNVEEFIGTFVLPIRPQLAKRLGALS